MIDPEDQKRIRARQRSRSMVTGLILGALVILFYFITVVKIAS
ncbi:hypothetical protein [Sphingomonas sp. SCN 67-18]|nr:hypothetical protein [Sphingomonas sp. SCN 67-18]